MILTIVTSIICLIIGFIIGFIIGYNKGIREDNTNHLGVNKYKKMKL